MDNPLTELERLYDAESAALFSHVLSLTRSEAETKDVLQEIFCRLAREPGLIQGMRHPRAFLMKMAGRQVIDRHRRQTVRTRHQEKESPSGLFQRAGDPDEAHFRQALGEAMDALPSEQRAVLHLKLWQEFTFEEIAEVLGIPPNTAASRYRYGLDKLRNALRPLYEEIQ